MNGLRLGVLVVGFVTSGCAALFKGGYQDVQVTAVPEASDVRVNGEFVGETPTSAKLDRNNAGNVVVAKEGFKEQYLAPQKKADTPWWIWDIATCVLPVMLCIPLGVDALSGAWFSYPDTIRVKLEPLPIAVRPTQENTSPAPAR